MIAVLQRVLRAQVSVDNQVISKIDRGMLVLAAALVGDTEADVDAIATKIAEYRIFEDDDLKMNRSIRETHGSILVVSQFTLAADGEKGRRPSFDRAATPNLGRKLIDRLVDQLRLRGIPVHVGQFGAAMSVELVNDGPATFVLERPRRKETFR